MFKRLWQTGPELVATTVLMLIVLTGAIVGLLVDPRVITGAPAWLKPAKFAVSIAIYTTTLAWIFTLLPEWPRTRRVVGWGTAAALAIEMVIIGGQAWRGTTSHFNVATPLDGVLWVIMGLTIVAQTLLSVAVAVALWKQRFDDAALGWALRLGMTVTIVGAFTGGLMTRPTGPQIEAARARERMTIAGAHTVGAADGGPGMVGTGWSRDHGDMRVPHFVGLHALQVLPVVALLMRRRRFAATARVRLVIVAATSYATLFVILLVQALRGVPVTTPDATTMAQLGGWALATALAFALVRFDKTRVVRDGAAV
ncbi:hypothetical protein LuPra_05282 [Luteitalea pratensis]|uniref:Uncharacterized protein n=1 Tax=Luteitalea pratensis TaxID=1855912 RepID=A0A143PVC2_LUTPR|nr:hypothetical protein [Luteitalea pratensis]AMY12010.1 hypothetical protein LuPra_05282 [Luteitalea pratensis]